MDYCANNAIDSAGNPFCQTVVENLYAPNLVYPTEFYDKYPQFSSCGFDYEGVFDPPTYLITVDSLPPTSSEGVGPTTTPASPGLSGHPVTPPATTVSFTQVPSVTTGVAGGSPTAVGPGSGNTGSGGSGPGNADPPGGSDPSDGGAPGTATDGLDPAPGNIQTSNPGIGSGSNADPAGSDSANSGSGTALPDTDPNDSPSATGAVIGLGNGGGTLTVSSNSGGDVVVAGTTLTPGGAAATVSGNVISAVSGGTIVVSQSGASASTIPLNGIIPASEHPSTVLTLGGQTITAAQAPGGGIVVGGSTISAGQVATIGGETVSALSDGSGIVFAQNGQTSTVSLAATSSPPHIAILTLEDGSTVTATSSTGANGSPVYIVGSQTLTSGGEAITTDGTILSVGAGGLVMSGSGSGSSVAGAVFTIGSMTFTAYESVYGQNTTVVVIGGQTATVGGSPITLPDGEVVSAGEHGLLMVGGGNISSVPYSAIAAATTTSSSMSSQSLTVLSPSRTASATPPATTSSKKGDAICGCTSIGSVFVACFFAALALL